MLIGWPLKLTSCGNSKFMKMICAFNELANFVHVEIRLSFKYIHPSKEKL